jgi:SAM-dependent methyltransferase
MKRQRQHPPPDDFTLPEPCPLLKRFAASIVSSRQGAPILDVACGAGRNAIFLAAQGYDVVCIDKNLTKLRSICSTGSLPDALRGRLQMNEIDLVKDAWPFGAGTIGAIINVHFLLPALFPCFESSLISAGRLLVESVPAHGGNYLELPKAGNVRTALQRAFDFEFYKERKAGPGNYDAVTVQLVAKRRG